MHSSNVRLLSFSSIDWEGIKRDAKTLPLDSLGTSVRDCSSTERFSHWT